MNKAHTKGGKVDKTPYTCVQKLFFWFKLSATYIWYLVIMQGLWDKSIHCLKTRVWRWPFTRKLSVPVKRKGERIKKARKSTWKPNAKEAHQKHRKRAKDYFQMANVPSIPPPPRPPSHTSFDLQSLQTRKDCSLVEFFGLVNGKKTSKWTHYRQPP